MDALECLLIFALSLVSVLPLAATAVWVDWKARKHGR